MYRLIFCVLLFPAALILCNSRFYSGSLPLIKGEARRGLEQQPTTHPSNPPQTPPIIRGENQYAFNSYTALEAAKQNLLLITIDTLRADHLGCYGNREVRTPNLDAIASESLFFENAVCPAPLTLPSHTSLMTGRNPYQHGVRDNTGAVNQKELTLAEILHQNGYHTYAFVSGFPLEHRFGLNQGFEIYDDAFPRDKNRALDFHSERSADATVKAVVSTTLSEPYFLWIDRN